jgi:TonB-linked SusC/RagA family outer membrane protein
MKNQGTPRVPEISMLFMFVIFYFFSSPLLIAQTKSNTGAKSSSQISAKIAVNGTVIDDKGIALPGVSVIEKATTNGVTTNVDGNFKLSVKDVNSILIFKMIGFASQEVRVGSQTSFKIKLITESSVLNEIVVIGYGTQKRKDVTGSVSTAPIEDMKKAPVTNYVEALEGRISGVVVSSSDGQPGAVPNIVIRGSNSATQDNSPLYVIDGIPVEGLNNSAINPQDIESIEVLKDASSTAIYGARGANGVILITSKKGKIGAPVINFGFSSGFQKITKKLAMMSPYEYVLYQRQIDSLSNNYYSAKSPIGAGYVTDSTFLKYWSLDKYKSVSANNLQDLMFVNAPMNNYNLSVSGGEKKTRYFISGNIMNQNGILVNSGFKRYTGKVVLDQEVSDKLKLGISGNYSNTYQWGGNNQPNNINQYFTSTFSPNFSIYGYRPVSPLDINGNQTVNVVDAFTDPALQSTTSSIASSMIVNPYINQINQVKGDYVNNLIANGYIDYKILPSLTLHVTGGVTINLDRNEQFYNTFTSQGSPLTNAGSVNGVNGSVIFFQNSTWVNENTLTYNTTFSNKQHLNVLVGMTESGINTSSYGSKAVQLPNPAEGVSGLDEGTPSIITAASSNSTLASFLGRVNYDFNTKYYFTVGFRADGSSRFDVNNKWGYFPSGAFKWRFSQEKFLENSKILSDGGLRISYGKTGNNRVGDFSYLSTIKTSPYTYVLSPSGLSTGAFPSTLANNNLKWETTDQVNLGLDLGLFNNRISFVADLYRKVTSNLLLNSTIPTSSGFQTVYANVGSIENKGLELSLNTTNIKSDNGFTWTSSFNIAFNQNKILSLAQNQESLLMATNWDQSFSSLPAYINKVGQPLGQMYGLVWDGVYQYSDFNISTAVNSSAGYPGVQSASHYVLKDNVPTNGAPRASIQPGDIKYKDINGDGIINSSDYTVIGNGLPIHTGGFGNNFSYKGFDLNIFLQWSYGQDVQNAGRYFFDGGVSNYANGRYINQLADYNDRWSANNTTSSNYRIGGWGPAFYSSRTIEDGSYLRLKTVQLSYNISSKVLKRVDIKSFRIYLSAQNLYTWTKYTGQDPEISTYNSVLTPNFDWSGYQRAATFTLGANVSF